MLQFKIFRRYNLIQGVSDVFFGSVVGQRGNVRLLKFLKSVGYKNIVAKNLVQAEQVFGSNIHICGSGDSGKTIKNVDGLISNIPNQILAIRSADCVPILFFDPKNKVVVGLHGARKCLLGGIVQKTLKKMVLNFQTNPKEILVALGPHIRKCHYWLYEKTLQQLKNPPFQKYFLKKKNKIYFDLTKLTLDELLRAGVKKQNIEDCKICTYCSFQQYFSARKKEEFPEIYKEKIGRFVSFIGFSNA